MSTSDTPDDGPKKDRRESARSATAGAEPAKPDAGKRDAGKPDAGKPDAGKPDPAAAAESKTSAFFVGMRNLLDAHFFTLLTAVAGLLVLIFVEQVSHVAFYLPSPRLLGRNPGLSLTVLGFWFFVLSVIVLYSYCVLLVVPSDEKDTLSRGFVQWREYVQAKRKPDASDKPANGAAISNWKFNYVCWFSFLILLGGLALLASPLYLKGDLDQELRRENLGWAFVFGVLLFYLWTWVLINKRRLERLLDLPNLLLHCDRWQTWLIGGVSFAVGLLVLVTGLTKLWNAASALGIWLILMGIWLGGISIITSPQPSTDAIRRTLGRALAALMISGVLGEAIWVTPVLIPNEASYRNYTIWAIFDLLFMSVLVARVLDYWQHRSQWPIRFATVLVLVALAVYFSQAPTIGTPGQADPQNQGTLAWLEAFEKRLDKGDPDRPAIAIAASGGGSRAALFSSLVYELIAHEPIGPDKGSWDRQVVVVSSVSGGSLASADFAADAAGKERDNWQHSVTREVIAWMTKKADEFVNRFAEVPEDDEAAKKLKAFQRERMQGIAKLCRQIEADPTKSNPRWLLRSVFADDMCTDYMAPLLRGVMLMHLERGESTTKFWEEQFNPAFSVTNHSPANADKPMLLLNATRVQTGRRLVIGFPAVPQGLFAQSVDQPPPDRKPPGAALPSPLIPIPMSLADFDPDYQMTLAEAVRLSANFPYGFDPGALRLGKDANVAADGSKADEHFTVVDGGVLDNTGMDTLAHLFQAIDRLGHGAAAAPKDAVKQKAEAIMLKLRKRGLVILEIDSGAKPGRPNALERQFANVSQPMEAINKAGYVNSILLKHRYQNEIDGAILPWENTDAPKTEGPSCVDLDVPYSQYAWFQCNHSEDVMTAWSLGPNDKAAILVQFLAEMEWKKKLYFEQFHNLTANIRSCEALHKIKDDTKRKAAEEDLKKKLRVQVSLQAATTLLSATAQQVYQKPVPEPQQMTAAVKKLVPAMKVDAKGFDSGVVLQMRLNDLKPFQLDLQKN
jgi:predicted acylesterase/phospholipase RssA